MERINIVKEFSCENIQKSIRAFLDKKEFSEFLDKIMQEETINDFSEILKGTLLDLDDNKIGPFIRLSLFLCFRELITIDQLINFLKQDGMTYLKAMRILETIYAFDLRFFSTPVENLSGSLAELTLLEKDYIRNYIPRVLIGRDVVGISSYKDLENLDDELERIFGRVSGIVSKDEILNFIKEFSDSTSNVRTFFTVNENLAELLYAHGIFTISTILNNNAEKISVLKEVLNYGEYPIIVGKNEEGKPIIEVRKFSDLLGESAFGFAEFNSSSNLLEKDKFLPFLVALFKGTINY